jgi:hypothetical protein
MRRDMSLVRQLLLLTEEQGKDMNAWIEDTMVEGFTNEQISYHVWLLNDAGLIEAQDLSDDEGVDFRPKYLTWQGHEFLAAVRERDIWQRTLEIAKQGGTASFSALWDIAKGVAKKKLEKLIDAA